MIPITDQVEDAATHLAIQDGAVVVFIPHTTAAVTVNESADPMVAHDVLSILDRVIPFHDSTYRHIEANSAPHIKSILVGTSETVIMRKGRLHLGTWQGLFCANSMAPGAGRCTWATSVVAIRQAPRTLSYIKRKEVNRMAKEIEIQYCTS